MLAMSAAEGAALIVAPAVARRSYARVAVWSLAVAVPLLALATVVGHLHNGDTDLTSWWYGSLALALTLLVPGLLVAYRRPANPVGWLICTACLCEAICAAGREYLVYGALGGTAPGSLWLGWAADSCYLIAIGTLPTMLMLFPDGRPMSRRTRPLVALPLVALAIGLTGYLFTGDVADIRGREIANPGAGVIPDRLAEALATVGQLLMLGALLAAAALIVLRLRAASGDERQQIKWVAWAGAIEALEVITEFVPGNIAATYTSTATDALLAAAIAIAILRHRLFDIDVVINRTLVFVTLSAVVVGGYLVVVGVLGAALGEPLRLGPGLVATALVAVAFAPARVRVQRGVDRLLYGERRNPYRVITQLGERLQRNDGTGELSVVVDTVIQALKLPYAAIEGPGGDVLAAAGRAGTHCVTEPLSYQGAEMGRLVVCPRDRRVRLDRDEARLLRDLARQVGAAVHAVQLSADLQASRRRLVSAKEEERRRLRRDLHDGLGPKLAAVILKLDAVEAITETRPEQGRQVLAGVQRDIRETIADVRQLVYGLRPPTLDDLGLVGALGECAARFDDTADAPQISVTADQLPPTLPAAVEVAAYWIATEAMTNAVRHAGAAHCAVRVWLAADILELRITDDGRGLAPDARAGVGTTSMRERAAELGGTVTIDSRPDGQGVEVVASIPCGAWT